MKTASAIRSRAGAYLLMEALVYIGLVGIILGLGFAVMYRSMDNFVLLRRSSEDLASAMKAGERWRADIRKGTAPPELRSSPDGDYLLIPGETGGVIYMCETNTVMRWEGQGPWMPILKQVATSSMAPDRRQNVTAWRWEVELLPRTKGYNKAGKVRPLFTFTAVPERRAP